MTDNVINFTVKKAFRNADQCTAEMHAEAVKGLEELSTVNLLELEPRTRQKAIRQFASFKQIAATSSEAFGERVAQERRKLGRACTEDEMLDLLDAYDPNARRVSLV